MPNQVRIGVGVAGAKGAASDLDRLRDKFTGLQKQGAKGLAIGAGVAATTAGLNIMGNALAGVGDKIGEAISDASALQESLGKSQVVFGESADEIEEWANTASKSFGLSKQAALEAAGTYGNLFQAFGVGADKATEMSTTLVELAADLASFNNTSIEDALIALRSGLSGETEPLKRYGIAISDARMRTELMAQGVKNLGATLTPLQKTQAAYALILKDSTLAQGDFARTSDGLANTQRTLAAQMKDLSAEIGAELLPVARDLAQFARDELVPALKDVVAVGKEVGPIFAFMGDAAQNFVDPLGRTRDALIEEAIAAEKARQAHEAFMEEQRAGERPMRDAANATGNLADETDGLTEELMDAEDAARDLDKAIGDLADEMYGGAITAGDLAEAQQELADLLEEGADATRPGDWTIYQGNLAEARKRVFELQAQMAQDAGPEAFLKWLEAQEAAAASTDTEILELIRHMKQLAAQAVTTSQAPIIGSGGRNVAGGQTPRASGGPVSAGQPYLVGEQGPEIVVPSTSGTVIPNSQIGGVGGTNLYLTFNGNIGERKEDVVAALQRAAAFVRF